MPFLNDSDYDVQARAEVMRILEVSTISRGMAENMAEEEMTSYLRPRGYDIPAIFSAIEAERNPLIIMYMIDIALYHLHSNITTRATPAIREKRYDAAIDWLEKVSRGSLDPSLPYKSITPDDSDATPLMKLGGGDKYFSRW